MNTHEELYVIWITYLSRGHGHDGTPARGPGAATHFATGSLTSLRSASTSRARGDAACTKRINLLLVVDGLAGDDPAAAGTRSSVMPRGTTDPRPVVLNAACGVPFTLSRDTFTPPEPAVEWFESPQLHPVDQGL